ncbi:hypothetical protein SAMN05421543_102106 [Alicyclobacillus macrosporangiidus]|uniref:Uncharacterized protein n=1 Tax=Alicyclobacillus macrosporangiidus TaxID=392015 RepID=A0A1I7GAQ7_9BACL|nr:hypothetical protein SAMN05421543_102106 [Alicyclobacillus macrosporangiidus]
MLMRGGAEAVRVSRMAREGLRAQCEGVWTPSEVAANAPGGHGDANAPGGLRTQRDGIANTVSGGSRRKARALANESSLMRRPAHRLCQIRAFVHHPTL